ncbi:hypothetical protein GZ979_001446 [Clostridium perfringens]|uniref:hypothetical protein n=2 Tax=Clostridium perfringens TaxID=1502 RepID=UPI000F5386DD|nr:hypothetical protein [Clostridium perfringens]ELC8341487.1 hypothetical protein [Clostridium perfringens]NGU50207.1 hypothetical protein [Clostridium perfringens]HAT4339735.1 hypothetical protein [Clostridium perfringens]HAT4346714.1 hypothetical protein [Clostridium perfringens]
MDSIFNIYYMNFNKVYEIKTMLSNVIKLTSEISSTIEEDKQKELAGELSVKSGVSLLNLFNIGGKVSGNYKKNASHNNKILENFEVQITKSVILSEVLEKCKGTKKGLIFKEGDLVRIDNVNLSLENEEELRIVKLVTSGMLNGLQIPEANGLDLNNIVNSVFKDYSYKIKGNFNNEKILFKIPLSFENEFESNYSIDDLFLGKVTLVGIYKGKIKVKNLKNTFEYLSKASENSNNFDEKDIISNSQFSTNNKETKLKSENDNTEYHFIDILAVLQTINMIDGDSNE